VSEGTHSSGIAKRIVRAAGAQGVNQLARVVQLFLLVPICLGAWGTGLYEDWVLLNAIAAFLMLTDIGFVQSTMVKLLDAWSKGDPDRFSREWGLALGIFSALSAGLIFLLGLSWISPIWAWIIPARQLQGTELASLAVLVCLTQVASILITLGLAVYRARGDLSRSYHVSSILVALQTVGIVLPALMGDGPVGAAAGTNIATIAMLIAMIADLRLRYPDMAWRPHWPSTRELLREMRNAVGYLSNPVATTIMLQGPTVILAQSGAPQGAIALFTATRTIAGAARQLPYQFAHPAGVELAGLLARGDRASLSRVYASASRALAIIVGALSGFTLVVAPLVMVLWTRGKIPYDGILMLVMVATTAICAPSQVAYQFLWYGGYPGRLSKALILSTCLAIGAVVLLAPPFEARGAAIGLGIGEVVGVAVYLSFLVDRMLGRNALMGLLRNFAATVLAFLASAGACYLIDHSVGPRGWFGLIEFAVLWTLPAAVGLYWTLLNGEQRTRVAARALGFLRSRRTKPSGANTVDAG
jgi:O-antigen/teichoic acid export membrane protein